MKRRRLPIGIQTLRKLRQRDCYYVDKTAYIEQLWNSGECYFPARPRRFGKSLFVDSLNELLKGNEALSRGLHIHDRWDSSVRRAVLRLSFDYGHFHEPGHLHTNLMEQLGDLEIDASTGSRHRTGPGRLAHLIRTWHRRSGKLVVVLVDEYDKPILDALEGPEVARANRNHLRGLYGVTKGCDEHIRFTFITGVSKSSKVSLFSGLNSLEDITLAPAYSAICRYTDADLDEVFAPELPGSDRARIRRWYDGYNWLGDERIYNSFYILLLFKKRVSKSYSIETGTSTSLLDVLAPGGTALHLEEMRGDEELLSQLDVGDIGTEALLFQTGYLMTTGEGFPVCEPPRLPT